MAPHRHHSHGVRARLDQADVLARAVGLDMVQVGWKPSVDNYLGRVTKPRILEAVREARGESSAQLIDHLKKADMAKEAERLLDGSGWLPEPLRLVDPNAASVEQESEACPLPEFLGEDEDRENTSDEDPQQLDAAE
jgi:ParB family transcriptional regulator, chromosome partitioning protein